MVYTRDSQPLSASELDRASERTLSHYEGRVEAFWEGTKDHDVSQNVEALLHHLPADRPLRILDFGCGPGRDLLNFQRRGHLPVGLDGSEGFCRMARQRAGVEVWHQDFLRLDLPPDRFDGVFANASLFHVPLQELPRVLSELRATLKPGGVLFCSNPRGRDQEGWSGERYGSYHSLPAWRALLEAADLIELEHYYRPAGLPREEQPWLASVWRRA